MNKIWGKRGHYVVLWTAAACTLTACGSTQVIRPATLGPPSTRAAADAHFEAYLRIHPMGMHADAVHVEQVSGGVANDRAGQWTGHTLAGCFPSPVVRFED